MPTTVDWIGIAQLVFIIYKPMGIQILHIIANT